MDPLVSVVIPTFNRPEELRRAIASVKHQTYQNLEIIVVNDGGIEVIQVIDSFRALNIKYIRNDRNDGISRSRNIGMELASGKYIALLDDDDEFLPEKIAEQVRISELLKKCLLVLCGGRKDNTLLSFEVGGGFVDRKEIFHLRANLPNPSAWFFPKEIIKQIGYFDENLRRWEDADYCIRIMSCFPVYMIDKPLVVWHSSEISITSSGFCKEDILARKHFLDKHFNLMKENDPDYGYRFVWKLGKNLKQIKKIKESKEIFKKAFLIKPYKLEVLPHIFDFRLGFILILLLLFAKFYVNQR